MRNYASILNLKKNSDFCGSLTIQKIEIGKKGLWGK